MSKKAPSSPMTILFQTMGKLPLSMVRRMGRIVGWAGLRFDHRTRYAIDRNLELCLPHLSKAERLHLRNHRLQLIGQTFTEMGYLWTRDTKDILARCKDGDGAAEFRQALQAGTGVMVLAPHFGNWEAVNACVCAVRSMTAMYRPNKDASLDAFILAARSRIGSELAPTNRRGVMQLVKALNSDGVVGILPDQVPQKGSGEFAPFFKHQAYTMTLASQLAQKTKAKAFVVGCMQTNKGFELVAHEVDERFYDEDIHTSLAGLNGSIERLVMKAPEQYQWEYKRFKRQPNDGGSLYKKKRR